MADIEKRDSTDGNSEIEISERPGGFKGFYTHPITQVVMLGFVCFMGPGLFNAVNGLGGGGQLTATVSANSNSALYATFAFSAFFSGSINNVLGPRITLLIGSTGYCLYIGSYLSLNIHPNSGAFVIAAGAILGICAGLLWTAQGSLMLAYPTESQKGIFIGIFWTIFNLGGVVGSAVSFGNNFHSTGGAVSNSTYIAFIALTAIGVCLPMCMAEPTSIIRTDGTRVTTSRNVTWKTEIYGLYLALRNDPAVIMLFPLFFASNWFYTWQFNDYNGALFNIRTRGLNSMIYWSSQMFGSVAIGLLLDQKRLSRRARAFAGWIVLFIMVFIIHIWAYEYQKDYTRASVAPGSGYVTIDFSDSVYPSRVWLYIFCGLLDSMWQTAAYWMMGAMSNDPAKLAYLTGFYKSLQSAGAAGVWRADGVGLPFMNIFISTWALLVAGLLCALPMLYYRVKEHTEPEDEDIHQLDQTGHIPTLDDKN